MYVNGRLYYDDCDDDDDDEQQTVLMFNHVDMIMKL